MNIRRILIFAPVVLILVLFQSYFWVPSYEQQTRGNPERLQEFITASIGDASILNPILSADSASSEIQAKVFEGLIDRDEELRFRGRLASSWEIFEEAYFYVNDTYPVPNTGSADPQSVIQLLKSAIRNRENFDTEVKAALENIEDIALIPARKFRLTKTVKNSGGKQENASVNFDVSAPSRIKLTLKQVDQDLFKRLSRILGSGYFNSFQGRKYLKPDQPLKPGKLNSHVNEILPATEHNPVLIFRLRPGVTFHDGHPVDAHDVKFTYDAIMDPKNLSPRISDYEPVKSVEVINPLTVRIVYKRLYSPAIGTWAMPVIPEHLLNKKRLTQEAHRRGIDPDNFTLRQSAFNRQPVGCGPFVFREWKSDQYIVLDRFDKYWEGPSQYRRYLYRVIPDPLTQEMEFYAGTIDNYGALPHQVARLKEDDRFQNFTGTSFGYTYIGYNLRRKPFDDVRVRRALGMAIDINKIIRYVLYGQGERITGPFVTQTAFYNHDIQPTPYDPEGALQLLKESGWARNSQGWLEKNGQRLQFTLITNSGNDLRKAILAIAQDSWKQIGIDVRTDLLEWSVFIQERVNKLDFDALILGWSMGIEPDLFQIWHSSQTNPYQLNFVGFNNREADDLIIKIRQEYDHDRQVDYCHRLHDIIAREQPYTFLYVGKWTALLDRRIVIKETDKDGSVVYRKIKPTKTGSYAFHFNQWVKLSDMPNLAVDG